MTHIRYVICFIDSCHVVVLVLVTDGIHLHLPV